MALVEIFNILQQDSLLQRAGGELVRMAYYGVLPGCRCIADLGRLEGKYA